MAKKIHKLSLKEKFDLWLALNGLTYADLLWLAFAVGIMIWLIL